MANNPLKDQLDDVATNLEQSMTQARDLLEKALNYTEPMGVSPFLQGLTVFVLAVFVGYHVVWRVTPALHSPLMSVTNAISSVIIVGALIAAGPALFGFSKILGFVAVVLASINIFGGFMITHRMLEMFKSKVKG